MKYFPFTATFLTWALFAVITFWPGTPTEYAECLFCGVVVGSFYGECIFFILVIGPKAIKNLREKHGKNKTED